MKQKEIKKQFLFIPEVNSLSSLTPYIPGVLLFFAALVIAMLTYKDYGVSWDEAELRNNGLASYNYIFNGNQDLFSKFTDHHGMGFELLLIFFEKWTKLSDSRDIFLMRHLVSHIFFLVSVLCAYILIFRLFKSKFIACLGFTMIAFSPRLYAHSFFNTRDLPFLSMFIITLMFCQIAFDKNKPVLFFIAGLACGYATSIRIMGIMLAAFILLFLLIDFVTIMINKGKLTRPIINIVIFLVGFCLLLLIAWPYLWQSPIHNFIAGFKSFSHYGEDAYFRVLFNGKVYFGENLPWTYVPTWFLISNPEAWLIAGFGGIIWISINLFKRTFIYLKNTPERNFLLYLMCFFVPVLTVIFLRSVIYNDWRHLYFIYPPFVLIALYFINKIYRSKYSFIVQSVCAAQIGLISYFMIRYHPFQQIYFNNFVSHAPQYLLKNYDLEYWGCSYKQGLQYLLEEDKSRTIKINCFFQILLDNNTLLLPQKVRERIKYADLQNAACFIPVWTEVDIPHDYLLTKIDSITVLNSNIFCIFRIEKDSARQSQFIK